MFVSRMGGVGFNKAILEELQNAFAIAERLVVSDGELAVIWFEADLRAADLGRCAESALSVDVDDVLEVRVEHNLEKLERVMLARGELELEHEEIWAEAFFDMLWTVWSRRHCVSPPPPKTVVALVGAPIEETIEECRRAWAHNDRTTKQLDLTRVEDQEAD